MPSSGDVFGEESVASWPRWHPPLAVLELTELVATGMIPALPQDVPAHIPWAAGPGQPPGLVLEDGEGTPVAAVWPDGGVRQLRPFAHPPMRSARHDPHHIRQLLADMSGPETGNIIAVPVATAMTLQHVAAVQQACTLGTVLLWLPLIGAGRGMPPIGLPPQALVRAVNKVAASAVAQSGEHSSAPAAHVVAPIALPHGYEALLLDIATALGASHLMQLPEDHGPLHPVFAAELTRAIPSPTHRGVVVFFTGLSGSGKSTLAKAVADRILHDTPRRITMLDGDEVRRLLSQGLGFSRQDRDVNIRRIGFVAAEVAHHGGIAICAPIAPQADVREDVRQQVYAALGDFILIHVATPLEECERRDRKGLYAAARRGEIPEFTGISAPYEPPSNAELTIDTTGRDMADCAEQVWEYLAGRGYFEEDSAESDGSGGGGWWPTDPGDSRKGIIAAVEAMSPYALVALHSPGSEHAR